MEFRILKKSRTSRARRGIIKTPHGEIETPAFIPVATQATVKGLTNDQLKAIGVQAVLCNAYHLYLRPGELLIKKIGGLHKFMDWDSPIFTDSGGFQVFSLGFGIEHGVGKIANIFNGDNSHIRKKFVFRSQIDEGETEHALPYKADKFTRITDEGVEFRSHLDGSKHFLTPEKSIKIQENLGADIIFSFDECTSPLAGYEYTKKSLERTHRWAIRSLKSHCHGHRQSLFGIIQGGEYKDLRIKSAQFINSLDFDGFGIGGSFGKSYGDSKQNMRRVLDWTIPLLDENKPRHLLGIGEIDDIYKSVKQGIDTFDCVIPTRLGRNGVALIKNGRINIKAGRYLKDRLPIEKNCECYTCLNFKRFYISHLFRANEMLGPILTTIHNLYFMEKIMREIREQIK